MYLRRGSAPTWRLLRPDAFFPWISFSNQSVIQPMSFFNLSTGAQTLAPSTTTPALTVNATGGGNFAISKRFW